MVEMYGTITYEAIPRAVELKIVGRRFVHSATAFVLQSQTAKVIDVSFLCGKTMIGTHSINYFFYTHASGRVAIARVPDERVRRIITNEDNHMLFSEPIKLTDLIRLMEFM
jgi:hypothetical protein